MYCARVLAFILILVFTACAVVSIFMPLYRKKSDTTTFADYYWVSMTSTNTAGITTYSVENPMDFKCNNRKIFFLVSAALSTVGAVCGLFALLCASAHLLARRGAGCLCFMVLLLCVIAFACYAVCVALTAFMFARDQCKGAAGATPARKDSGYSLYAGFGLMCAACCGFFVTIIVEACV